MERCNHNVAEELDQQRDLYRREEATSMPELTNKDMDR